MREEGVVISTSRDLAVIELERGEFCKSCNVCDAFGEGKMYLEAKNPMNARVGDNVRVEVASKHVLSGALLIFILPILAMIAGYFAGRHLYPGPGELPGIIGAFTGFVGMLIFNRFVSTKKSTIQTNAVIIGYGASGSDRNKKDH